MAVSNAFLRGFVDASNALRSKGKSHRPLCTTILKYGKSGAGLRSEYTNKRERVGL